MPAPDPSVVRFAGSWAHRDISANGIRLHIAEAGEGPTVILLHGFAHFWWVWHRQLTSLAEAGFHVVAVDLRGYGDSDKPPQGYDAWTLAGDIAGLIKALGQRRAHLVGHAWGGMLAWVCATMHPRLVSSVSVLGGAHPLAIKNAITRTIFRRPGANQALGLKHLFPAQAPLVPEHWLTRDGASYVEHTLKNGSNPQWADSADCVHTARNLRQAMLIPGAAHSALEYYRWAFRAQFRGEGRRFREAVNTRCPVPIAQIHGELDGYVLENTARASSPWRGPRSEFTLFPGVGHYPHLEAPDETNKSLLSFLNGNS